MSKERWYIEALGGSLDEKGQPRQMAAIYDHRGKLICDMVWTEDAERIGRCVNAHEGLVRELQRAESVLMTLAADPTANIPDLSESLGLLRAELAKATA